MSGTTTLAQSHTPHEFNYYAFAYDPKFKRSGIDVGTSAGGARAKAVIIWNPETDEIRSGHSVAPQDFPIGC